MKNHIFLQARLKSKRFPNKVLKKICGKTIIELIVERLRKIKNIDDIILVTGPKESNTLLLEEAKRLDLKIFCGSEENVLDRFYKASKKFQSDIITRITADCPLIDFNVINEGYRIFHSGDYDVINIEQRRTFPDGFDFEIFKKDALHTSWQDNLAKFDNEEQFCSTFITPVKYMVETKKFKNFNLINDVDYSHIRLTLDYPEDLEFIKQIYEELYEKNQSFALKEILELLERKPELIEINRKYKTS